jgi:hypothetical protein
MRPTRDLGALAAVGLGEAPFFRSQKSAVSLIADIAATRTSSPGSTATARRSSEVKSNYGGNNVRRHQDERRLIGHTVVLCCASAFFSSVVAACLATLGMVRRRSRCFLHASAGSAPCRKDWLFVRKEALV